MDHGEDIESAIARELKEEVNLEGKFGFTIIGVEDPAYLKNANLLQVRLIFSVTPETMPQSAGEDAREAQYIDPNDLKNSDNHVERKVYEYAQVASITRAASIETTSTSRTHT